MAYTNHGTWERSELPKAYAYMNTTSQGTRPAKVPNQKEIQLVLALCWVPMSYIPSSIVMRTIMTEELSAYSYQRKGFI